MYFLVEIGFHHIGEAGLELLSSNDSPALASQVLGLQVWATAPGLDVHLIIELKNMNILTQRIEEVLFLTKVTETGKY